MGDKATCPVCDSHTGAIYYAFENLSPCPVCGTSFETIQVFKDIKNKKEQYKKAKLEKGVIEEIISLRKELALSKEREKKL
jgi:hypothetical protein